MAYHDRNASLARIEPPLAILEPRKTPRQARARATFAAIVDACAQLLSSGGYDALTTNAISERAGVSVGTLYEYFPNRESIVVALAADACRRLVERMTRAAEEADGMTRYLGAEHLIRTGVETLGAPENGFKALLREAPFVMRLRVFQEARNALDRLSQEIGRRAGGQIHLPAPQADAWLISQMLFSAMVEIAFLETPPANRDFLVGQLAQLTFRMAVGRDANPDEMCPPAATEGP